MSLKNGTSKQVDKRILIIKEMTKVMESAGSRFTLRIPNLVFDRGKFYGIVGRSGSGKSTLLDLLATVAQPTSIQTYVLNVEGNAIDLSRLVQMKNDKELSQIRLMHFGYILQSGGLIPFLTVRQNLQLPSMLSGKRANPQDFSRLIDKYDIGDQLDKKPSALSGGQRQRVSVLRALSLSPEIVLADEPTASVDENMAGIIVEELKRLAASMGVTVIMVSHDLELVRSYADELIQLKPELLLDGQVQSTVTFGE